MGGARPWWQRSTWRAVKTKSHVLQNNKSKTAPPTPPPPPEIMTQVLLVLHNRPLSVNKQPRGGDTSTQGALDTDEESVLGACAHTYLKVFKWLVAFGLVLAFGLEDYWMCPASCEVVPPWIGFAGPTHLIDAQLDWALGNLEASGFHLPNTCNLRTDLIYSTIWQVSYIKLLAYFWLFL